MGVEGVDELVGRRGVAVEWWKERCLRRSWWRWKLASAFKVLLERKNPSGAPSIII